MERVIATGTKYNPKMTREVLLRKVRKDIRAEQLAGRLTLFQFKIIDRLGYMEVHLLDAPDGFEFHEIRGGETIFHEVCGVEIKKSPAVSRFEAKTREIFAAYEEKNTRARAIYFRLDGRAREKERQSFERLQIGLNKARELGWPLSTETALVAFDLHSEAT